MRVACMLSTTLVAWLAAAAVAAPQSGARVTGRVVTPYAELVPGAAVILAHTSGSGRTARAITSADGAFTFDNVTPGTYLLTASKTRYTDWSIDGARVRAGQEITIADVGPDDLQLTLARSGSIAGRIVRPDGTPAPGTQVMAARRDSGRLVTLPETRTISGWDGRYEMTGLPAGEFLVAVLPSSRDVPASATALPVDVSAAPLAFEPTLYPGVPQSEPGGTVAVYEGVATEGIDVWLMPAPQRFTVSGRVFWPEGAGVTNVAIEYGGSPDVRSGIWYVDDPGGLFTLEGISRGTLVLLARADSNRGPLVGLASTDVLIGPVEEVRLDLTMPGSVAGRVVFDTAMPGGAPVPRVVLTHTLLTVSPLFPTEGAVPDGDGRFHIPHARGAYVVGVEDLPRGWRIRRVLRNGRALPGNRLMVDTGDRIDGIEVHIGSAP